MTDAGDSRRESNHAADAGAQPHAHISPPGGVTDARVSIDPNTWNPRIRQRYSFGNSRRRRIASVVSALALLLAPVGVWSLWQAGGSDVVAVIGPYSLTQTSVRVQMTYQTDAGPDAVVTCALRAQDSRRIDVGYAYLRLPGTAGQQRTVSYALSTTTAAVAAELLGCHMGDDTSRLPAAQFPPGVKPPAQEPPGRAPSAVTPA